MPYKIMIYIMMSAFVIVLNLFNIKAIYNTLIMNYVKLYRSENKILIKGMKWLISMIIMPVFAVIFLTISLFTGNYILASLSVICSLNPIILDIVLVIFEGEKRIVLASKILVYDDVVSIEKHKNLWRFLLRDGRETSINILKNNDGYLQDIFKLKSSSAIINKKYISN
mgnify:CR=1 FL=1